MVMKMVYQLAHLMQREPLWIKGERPPFVHVIDICPHGFQGDIGLAIVVNHLGNVINIPITISAIVELLLLA